MTSGRVDGKAEIPSTSEDIKLHAKRLAMSAGGNVAAMYLQTKGMTESEAQTFLLNVTMAGGNRDDIKMSKCLHCVFRRCCNYAPYSCGCSLDDRTPIWKVNFQFRPYNHPGCEFIRNYESGWAEIFNPLNRRSRVVQVSPSNLTILINPSVSDISTAFYGWGSPPLQLLDKPAGNFILRGVLPLKDETYQDYQNRVAEIVKKAAKRVESKGNELDKLKAVFNAIGQGQLLNDMYGGDAMAMAADYFPYRKVSEIISEFTPTKAADDDVRKQAIAERKAMRKEAAK